jgi:hypothetical protein
MLLPDNPIKFRSTSRRLHHHHQTNQQRVERIGGSAAVLRGREESAWLFASDFTPQNTVWTKAANTRRQRYLPVNTLFGDEETLCHPTKDLSRSNICSMKTLLITLVSLGVVDRIEAARAAETSSTLSVMATAERAETEAAAPRK